MENLDEAAKAINAALQNLNEEDRFFILLNEAAKVETPEWQAAVLDLMKRMKLIN